MPRRIFHAGLFLIASYAVVKTADFLAAGARFVDDAYYYLVIARNFVDLGIFTFDGVNGTNGFHPLWEWICVGLYRLFVAPGDLEGLASAMYWAQFGLNCAFALLVLCVGMREFSSRGGRDPAFGFALFLAMFYVLLRTVNWRFMSGMETSLVGFLLVATILAVRWSAWRALAIVLPLLALSRLDTTIFVIAPTLVYLRIGRGLGWARLAAMAAPAGIAVAGYMAVNYVEFGHFRPISGAIKSSFPAVSPKLSVFLDPLLSAYGGGSLKAAAVMLVNGNLLVLGVAVAVAGAAMALRRRTGDGFALYLLAVAGLMLANFVLFQKWQKGVPSWYLGPPGVVVALLVGHVFWSALPPRRAAAIGGVGLAALFLGASVWNLSTGIRALGAPATEEPAEDFSACIRRNVGAGERIAGTDVGYLAYATGRPIVNLDGVVNNFAYQERLRRRELAAYLEEQGVDYLVLTAWSGPQVHNLRRTEPMYRHVVAPEVVEGTGYWMREFYVYSYLHNVFSDRIALTPGQEVCRSGVFRDWSVEAVTVLYRLR